MTLHEEWTALQKPLRADRERHNALSARLRSANPLKQDPHGGGGEKPAVASVEEVREGLLAEAKELKAKIALVEEKERVLEAEMKSLAIDLPNWTHRDTPVGSEPTVLGYINPHLAPLATATTTNSDAGSESRKSHTQIGAELGLLDFSTAATVSGWGWYYLLNEAVLLEQALVNYALSLALSKGWKLVSPPSIVYSHIATACGFKPRDQHGEQQVYTLDTAQGKIKHCLAGTAEIPLAGMYANKVFAEDELPVKVVGVGRAYRAEAGARGVESKGLYRVHEFTKVELFAWGPPGNEELETLRGNGKDSTTNNSDSTTTSTTTTTDPSEQSSPSFTNPTTPSLFSEMLTFQKTLITSLNLPARILAMPTTDLGASASRKIDIEAYMPSRKDPWGEISSLSDCADYQSRRLNTRVKSAARGNKAEFPYTLNATAVAVPRVLMAILENGWVEGEGRGRGGGVVVPEVLRPYMGGMEFIGRKR